MEINNALIELNQLDAKRFKIVDGNLSIWPFKNKDYGFYECIWVYQTNENNLTFSSSGFEIKPPKMIENLEYETNLGDIVFLICDSNGHESEKNVIWRKKVGEEFKELNFSKMPVSI